MRRDREFEQFVAERRRALVGFAYALVNDFATAEDIAAEALARVWTSMHHREVEQLEHYARRTVVNLVIGRQRRADVDRRYQPTRRGDWRVVGVEMGDFDDRLAAHDDLVAALATLPVEQRVTVVLRFIFDLSEEDTARLLGVPKGTVKSRVARAVVALRQVLSDDQGSISLGRNVVIRTTT